MDHNLINVTSGLISVVICTYNRSRLLINAIESVLSQSYPFKELIVLDGNSTDDTPNLMKQYETNPSVIYIRDVVDKGPQFYLKEGLRLSHGEYVVFMDDDDYYTDCDFFSKAINVYSNSKLNVLSFVSANVQKYDVIKSEYIDYVPLSISDIWMESTILDNS